MNRRAIAPAILAATVLALGAVALSAQGSRVAVSIPASSEILASCQGGVIYVTPEGAARAVGCSAPTTSTATVAVTPSTTPTTGPSATPSITPTPDSQWWLAGGVDPADVVGAWQAKGAASFASSLVSLSGGPALYVPQYAPQWSTSVGWQGGSVQRLQVVGEAFPAYGWTYFIKVRNATIGSQQFMGCRDNHYSRQPFGMDLNNTGAYQENNSFSPGDYGGVVLTGTMQIGGRYYYKNGVQQAPMAVGSGSCAYPLMILTSNWGGIAHGGQLQTEVQGVAVYSDTLTAGQAAAIATAVSSW